MINKKIITVGISSAIIGAGLLGLYLTPEQIAEIPIETEKEIVMIPEEYYQKILIGIADKYDLSQIAGQKKLDISYGNNEAYLLIDAWDRKLKKLNGFQFNDIDTRYYQKSIIYRMNDKLK